MTLEEFDEKVDQWHKIPFGSPGHDMHLHEYLGMTWLQYKEWIDNARFAMD